MDNGPKFYLSNLRSCFLFILFISNYTFAQQNDLIKILNIPCGVSIEEVKRFWISENLQKYADLNHQKDDVLKYEGKTDSLFLKCIFYFVDDSLYMHVLTLKQSFSKTSELLKFVHQTLGEPGSINVYKNKIDYNENQHSSTVSYWSMKRNQDISIDNISISEEVEKSNLSIVMFSKINSLLSIKAKALNKHRVKL